MPVVKPVTVMLVHVAEVNVPVIAVPTAVAVYEVIVAPPLEPGVVHATLTEVVPVIAAVPIVGAPGAVAGTGVTEFDAADATDVPRLFVAVTVNVYAVPVVKPVTVIALLHVAEVNVPVIAVPTAVAV